MRILLMVMGLIFLNACSAQSAGEFEVPAVIAEHTAESRAELQRLVSEALGVDEVTLAEDVLTRESALIIERNPPQDMRQRPLQGRNIELPKKFQLLLSDKRCWLERVSDGERWELVQTSCVPASAAADA